MCSVDVISILMMKIDSKAVVQVEQQWFYFASPKLDDISPITAQSASNIIIPEFFDLLVYSFLEYDCYLFDFAS